MLGKSATSPALESRPYVLQFSVPCSQGLRATGMSPMCAVYTLLLWLSCFCFSVIIFKDPLAVVERVLPPVVSGPFWSCLRPELTQPRNLPERWQHQTAGHVLCAVLREGFISGQDLQSNQMSAPSPLLGLQSDWYVVIFPCPHCRSFCWGFLYNARFMVPLWIGSSEGHIKEGKSAEAGGRGICSISQVFLGLL